MRNIQTRADKIKLLKDLSEGILTIEDLAEPKQMKIVIWKQQADLNTYKNEATGETRLADSFTNQVLTKNTDKLNVLVRYCEYPLFTSEKEVEEYEEKLKTQEAI